MKIKSAILFVTVTLLAAVEIRAYTVYTPPDNIVQNGNFQSYFANWSGTDPFYIFGDWSSVPNNYAALANDIYQDLPTSPGQAYSLSFYAAADLYFGPSVSV